MALKFYKGETINVLFTAYDDVNNLIDLSSFDKEVTVLTALSVPVVSTIIEVDSSSFKIVITPEQSGSLNPGTLYIVVVLSNSSGVQIGRSTFPMLLLDPESPNCEDRSLEEGSDLEMKISLGEKIANVKMYFSAGLPAQSAIVDTYEDMLTLAPSAGLLIVLVTSDTKNNNGNPSEYRKYANGITMWQASININQLEIKRYGIPCKHPRPGFDRFVKRFCYIQRMEDSR